MTVQQSSTVVGSPFFHISNTSHLCKQFKFIQMLSSLLCLKTFKTARVISEIEMATTKLPFRQCCQPLPSLAARLSWLCLSCAELSYCVFSVARHSSLAERLPAGHRMRDVHGDAGPVVHGHDLPSGQRVSDCRRSWRGPALERFCEAPLFELTEISIKISVYLLNFF